MKRLLVIWMICHIQLAYGQFKEVSQTRGVDHIASTALLMGGGACFFDYNNDGWVDLYLTGAGDTDKLLHNTGSTFVDISFSSKIQEFTVPVYSSGVVAGDLNNDGCDDLFISTFDMTTSKVFMGDCNGNFEDKSAEMGVSEIARSSGVLLLDYNLDGFLDAYVVNYVENSRYILDSDGNTIGFDHDCYKDFLYINNGGESFTFTESSLSEDGCGLAATTSDYNNDGANELLLINDFGEWIMPNMLLEKGQDGFYDLAETVGFDVGVYGMGIAQGDINLDGYQDYYITNLGRNVLLIYDEASSQYLDQTEQMNVENTYAYDDVFSTGWGTTLFDMDNDLDLDLFVTNGYISASDFLKNAQEDPNKLYEFDNGTFNDVSSTLGSGSDWVNRGVIQGDINNDGFLDLLVTTLDFSDFGEAHALLYENTNTDGNYLKFSLEGTTSNRNAFGSKVEIWVDNVKYMRELRSGGSHASQHSQVIHFGLGSFGAVDSVKITWPTSEKVTFNTVSANQHYHLTEGEVVMQILGCTDASDPNFDPLATLSSGCMSELIVGCMDEGASNFNVNATLSDGGCVYTLGAVHDDPSQIRYHRKRQELLVQESHDAEEMLIFSLNGSLVRAYDLYDVSSVEIGALEEGIYLIVLRHSDKIVSSLKIYKE